MPAQLATLQLARPRRSPNTPCSAVEAETQMPFWQGMQAQLATLQLARPRRSPNTPCSAFK